VLERTDAITWLSLRNAPEVHIVAVDQLNTYDVLAADDVVFTRGAYDVFVSRSASAGATAPVETAPVETAQVETAPVETAPVETGPVEEAVTVTVAEESAATSAAGTDPAEEAPQ
jgi:large subunit ribosomal protein L4